MTNFPLSTRPPRELLSDLVHNTREEYENGAFFLQLGLPSTKAFRKRSSNPRNFKTPALRISVDGKQFENVAFRKRWRHDNHDILLSEFSSNTNAKWPVILTFSNFSGIVRTENIWCVFPVKTLFSNSFGVVRTVHILWEKPALNAQDKHLNLELSFHLSLIFNHYLYTVKKKFIRYNKFQ